MRGNDFNHSYGNCSVDWFFSLVLEWTKQWVEQYYLQWLQVLLAQLMLLKRTRRNNPPNFSTRIHTKKLTWYENISHSSLITKQKEIWMMNTSDKSLLSFTRQNPLKILLKRLKMASQIGVEPTTFRLGGECSIQLSYWDTSWF